MGSPSPLDPLSTPGGSVEGIGEILSLVRHLPVAELHDAHGVGALALVGDRVLRDPEIALSNNSPNRKPRRLARMMAAKRLQVLPAVYDFARLWVRAHDI